MFTLYASHCGMASLGRKFRVGTRGSDLALYQTRHVSQLLAAQQSTNLLPLKIEEQVITTAGDVSLAERLVGQLEKGFFTQELEDALLQQRIDAAVHSLKDLPTKNPTGLTLGAILKRHTPCDWLIAHPESVAVIDSMPRLLPLKAGAVIGTSALRREHLIAHYGPQLKTKPLRGNVPTRLKKLQERQYDAIVLAQAGIERLGLDISHYWVFQLNPWLWPHAPGQGCIAVQIRDKDTDIQSLLTSIHHQESARAAAWERLFLSAIEGGCTTPFGCHVEGLFLSLSWACDGRMRFGFCTLPHHDYPQPVDFQFVLEQIHQLMQNTNSLLEEPYEWRQHAFYSIVNRPVPTC